MGVVTGSVMMYQLSSYNETINNKLVQTMEVALYHHTETSLSKSYCNNLCSCYPARMRRGKVIGRVVVVVVVVVDTKIDKSGDVCT